MGKRNSSIELLKVIAMIMIMFSSAIPYGVTQSGGGYESIYENLVRTEFSISHIIFTLFRYFGQIGDTIFIACSAFFLCDSGKIKGKKVVGMAVDSWIISMIGLFVALVFLNPTIKEVLKSLFPITFQMNWFIGCYIIYYLIHPMLNRAVMGLSKNQMKRLVCCMILMYSIIPMIIGSAFYYTNLVGFILIHYIVTYWKRYGFNMPFSANLFTMLSSAVLIIISIIGLNYFGQHISFLQDKNLQFCTFTNPLIIVFAMALLNISKDKVTYYPLINEIASFSLLVYLIHGQYFWLTYGKYELYRILWNYGIYENKILTALGVVFSYILISIGLASVYKVTISKGVDMVLSWMSSRINNKIVKKHQLSRR